MNVSKETDNSCFPEQPPSATVRMSQSPIGQVFILCLFVFVAEVVVIIILNFLKPMPGWVEILINPVILFIILTHILYFCKVRLLKHQLTLRINALNYYNE